MVDVAADVATPVAREASQADGSSAALPELYVIVHSVSKKHNIGMLLRSATAFGVKQMVVVGRRDLNTFGSHGAAEHVDLKHFHKLKDARTYLKERGCAICGVEIAEGAQPVQAHPFVGSTAFLLGNEGSGLSEQELAVCDQLVYIPQYGAGTASLNVVVAASIVMHQFASWAGYQERSHSEGKFLVGERPVRRGARNVCPDDPEAVVERRRERDQAAQAGDWLDHGEIGMFADEIDDNSTEDRTAPLQDSDLQ